MLTCMTYPNGVNTTYTYDTLYRLTDIVQQNGSQTLGSYTYTLDNAGNRTSVDEFGGSYYLWDYDDYYRLTSEERYVSTGVLDYNTAYEYDPAGNRTLETHTVNGQSPQVTDYDYNNLDQLTQSVTGGITTTYSYDARGNLEQMVEGSNTTTYTWDVQDRMTSANTPNGTASYIYDADGRRVQQTTNGQVTNYLWDELSAYGDVVLETNGSGTTLASYVLGNDRLISQNRGGALSYYLQDGQGSTRALTNNLGVVTDTYSYTAFGELQNQTGTTVNSYRYAGQQSDNLTTLYNLRARYYEPSSGRFISQDVYPYDIQNYLELNRYQYATNNGINFADPSGLSISLQDVAQTIKSAAIALGHSAMQFREQLFVAAAVATLVVAAGPSIIKVGSAILDLLHTSNREELIQELRDNVKEYESLKSRASDRRTEAENLLGLERVKRHIFSAERQAASLRCAGGSTIDCNMVIYWDGEIAIVDVDIATYSGDRSIAIDDIRHYENLISATYTQILTAEK